MKIDEADKVGAIIAMLVCVIIISIILSITGCTLHVVEPDGITEYCFADYYCEWRDINSYYHSEYLCYEDIRQNMICR